MRLRLAGGLARLALVTALAVGATAVSVFPESVATARSDFTSPYGYDRTWNSALRYVRVDLGLKILEKDAASGYLLFEYRSPESGPKPTGASFEIVRSANKDSNDVKVVAQITQMPQFHEQSLLEGLARKMHEEYGDPPSTHREAPPPPPSGDAGADGAEPDYDDDYPN
jgi:hypothetical protein